MNTLPFRRVTAAGLTAIAAVAVVNNLCAQPIPVRELAPVSAKTTVPLRSIFGEVRETPSGRLLVNDAISYRLLSYDPTLNTFTVLRDSIPGQPNSYGPRVSPMIRYTGDTSLFVDVASQTLLVIGPEGENIRAMALPNPRDIELLTGFRASADTEGRLVYLGRKPAVPPVKPGEQPAAFPMADSAPLLRADFNLRLVDTIARIKQATSDKRITTGTPDKPHVETIVTPLQKLDDWAVLTNGSIAIVRGHDYHIDFIGLDDSRTAAPKMPFAWRQLTDDDKQKLVDSLRTAQQQKDSAFAARLRESGKGPTIIRSVDGRNIEMPDPAVRVTNYVPLKEIPDYYPPIRESVSLSDRSNNVWVLPTTTTASINGELVYDVINARGVLFERVRIPAGRTIAGFGKNGAVYLRWRDGTNGWYIERTQIRR